MKINVYGRLMELEKENSQWVLYSLGEGKRSPLGDVAIPDHLNASEAVQFLDDLFHEMATPERPSIVIIS